MTSECAPKCINSLLNAVNNLQLTTATQNTSSSFTSSSSSSVRHSPPFRSNAPRAHSHPPEENTLMGSLIPKKVFVGGIAEETLDGDLRGVFSHYGHVQDIRIITEKSMTSKSGEPRRFAFVEFSSEEEVKNVLEEFSRRELELHGRRLNIGQAYRKVPTFGRVFTPSNTHSENVSACSTPTSASASSPNGSSIYSANALQNSLLMAQARVPAIPPQFPFYPYQFPAGAFPGYPYMLPPQYPTTISPPLSPQQQQQLLFQQAYMPTFGMPIANPQQQHLSPRENARPDADLVGGAGGYHGNQHTNASPGTNHSRHANDRMMTFGMPAEMGQSCGNRQPGSRGGDQHQQAHSLANHSLTVQNLASQEFLCHFSGPIHGHHQAAFGSDGSRPANMLPNMYLHPSAAAHQCPY